MVIEIKYDLKGSILDIGGGGEAVVGQIYGDRVTAIDNRQEELDEAPDCCTKLLMDAEKLLFSDHSFDNVTFFYTLMYMTEETQRKAICEAARVLKAGGTMCIWDCTIFSSTYPDPFVVDLDISSGGIIIHTSYGIVKRDTQSSDSIQKLLENAGLNIVSLKEADGQFMIQCRKGWKLKEFIDMIKEFEDDNYDIVSSKNDEAAKLAKLMNDLKDKSKKERQEYLKDVKDKASSFFINYLIERDYEKKYVFLQDETVDFEYELFNPYINPDKKEYSQKWHVMVSLLALLDVVNHAKEYTGKKYGVQGEIDYIDFDEKKITMKGTGGRPVTYRAPWASWVYKAKRESETRKNQ